MTTYQLEYLRDGTWVYYWEGSCLVELTEDLLKYQGVWPQYTWRVTPKG